MSPPLSGLTIIDLTRLLPGPFATLYLADLGATVIKVEDTRGGDYARDLNPAMFAVLNRNKASVRADLRSPEGIATVLDLVRDADAVVESFRPGVMDTMGLGFDALKAANPRIVLGSLTGYGQDGPYAQRPGHDLNYLGYAGVLDQMGSADGPPAMANLQIADLAGGALTFALGLVSALLDAQRNGTPRHVDVAMTDASAALLPVPLATLNATGAVPARGADMLSGGLPNYSVYACADGKHIALGALEPKFWLAFCQTAERPDLAKMPLSIGPKGEALRDALTKLFATRTRDEWVTLLADADACVGPVLDLSEAMADPHMASRAVFVEAEGQRFIRCPIRFAGEEPGDIRPAPAAGADNARYVR